jgi:tetratricopeptide (TPR) repeat protein
LQELDAPDTPRAKAITSLQAAQDLDALRETVPRREWRAQAEAEWEHWRGALEWALGKQGNILLGQRLVGALETAWWVFPEEIARHWVRAAFALADEMTPRNVVARMNLALARQRLQHHRFKSCHTAAERALTLARATGDELGVARAEFVAGHSLVVLGQLKEGEKLLESALAGFRKLGARRSIGRTLASLALAREHGDDIAAARSFCGEAVETLKTIEGDDGEPDYVSYLAELEFQAGNAEQALRLSGEALARHRKLNDRLHTVVDLSNTAAYLIALDRYGEAREGAREALTLAVEENNALWTAFALQHLATVAALEGDAAGAARLIGYVDARVGGLEHEREHTEQREHERLMNALRKALSEDELGRLAAEGRAWSEERALDQAGIR